MSADGSVSQCLTLRFSQRDVFYVPMRACLIADPIGFWNGLSVIIQWRWSEVNHVCVLRAGGWGGENGSRMCWQRPPAARHARSCKSITGYRMPPAGQAWNCTHVSIWSWPTRTRSTTSHMCPHSVWAKVVTHLFWQAADWETLVVVGKNTETWEFQGVNKNTCRFCSHRKWGSISAHWSRGSCCRFDWFAGCPCRCPTGSGDICVGAGTVSLQTPSGKVSCG